MWVRWSISTFSRSMPRGVIWSRSQSTLRASGTRETKPSAFLREPKSSNIASARSTPMSLIGRPAVSMPHSAARARSLGSSAMW